MKKNLVNDEIDLIEVFQIIWRKKKLCYFVNSY